MTEESLVLLQNKNNILPLNKHMKIAVMGPNANDSVMQWGNYNGFPGRTVTVLDALRQRLGMTLFMILVAIELPKPPSAVFSTNVASTVKKVLLQSIGIHVFLKVNLLQYKQLILRCS